MKNFKTITFSMVLILISSCISLTGCASSTNLLDTAQKNMEISKKLPQYNLNQKNFKEVSYDGKTYCINEESINIKILNKPIGKVSQDVTIDENNKKLVKKDLMKIDVIPKDSEQKRINLKVGWVYSIKNIDSNNAIAILVNEKYRKAEIEK